MDQTSDGPSRRQFAWGLGATGLALLGGWPSLQEPGVSLERPLPQKGGPLYVTVRRYEGVTDSREAGRRVAEGFVPLIRAVPGFVAYYWIDAGGGVMISASVFENQDGAERSNQVAADFARVNLVGLLPNLPQVTAGEVVAYGAA